MSKLKTGLLGMLFLIAQNLCAAPAEIIIIRHGEKPPVGNELNARGWERANELVNFFSHDARVLKFGKPVAIYAVDPESDLKSLRPVQTVTPLAKALNLSIHQNYSKNQAQELIHEIMNTPEYDGKMVLICWEHKAIISDLLPEMGILPSIWPKAPSKWPGNVFDWALIVDYQENGQIKKFKKIHQFLPMDFDQ
jgi:hypothetical protein